MEIADKVAIITGASGGIGLATARLFAERGARVALVARSAERIQQLATELPGALAVPTDMRDTAAVHQMIAKVQQHYGRIDILINNIRVGLMLPGITATGFARNAVSMTTGQTERHLTLPADAPEHVATKILEAVSSEIL